MPQNTARIIDLLHLHFLVMSFGVKALKPNCLIRDEILQLFLPQSPLCDYSQHVKDAIVNNLCSLHLISDLTLRHVFLEIML